MEEKSIRQKLLSAHLRDFAVPPPLTTQQGFVLRKYFFWKGPLPTLSPSLVLHECGGERSHCQSRANEERGGNAAASQAEN